MWLCSTPVGAITDALGIESAVLGGWMNGAYADIASVNEVKLLICYPQNRSKAPEEVIPTGLVRLAFIGTV